MKVLIDTDPGANDSLAIIIALRLLTNIAKALVVEPHLVEWIPEIVIIEA